MANPIAECTNNPTLNVPFDQMAVRVCFPATINSVHPIGDPQTMPYNIREVLKSQISSFIPGKFRFNYINEQCDIIIVPKYDGIYLTTNFPEFFTQY